MENRITIITIREGIAENEAALLWEQLLKLINGFKRDIGEEPLTEEGQQRLRQAMKDGRITFFLALCGDHAVGVQYCKMLFHLCVYRHRRIRGFLHGTGIPPEGHCPYAGAGGAEMEQRKRPCQHDRHLRTL